MVWRFYPPRQVRNPAFTTWNDLDQRAVILLNSSLNEEVDAEVFSLTTTNATWTALETAYNNSSVERIHSLRDSLRSLSKVTSIVSDYGRQFKGASFETFSAAIRTTKPSPTYRDLLSQAESHEMFLKSLHGSATPYAAFFFQQSRSGSL
ncbi:zinc finger, CCHC-type containing LTR copia-type gag-polypeptide [Tanacetum coccineum]